MKFTTIFSTAALALSAIAEPVPRLQSNTRDIAAVQSAAASITNSIKTLTKSIAQFNGDSIQVEADATALATTIELSTEDIIKSGNIDVAGLAGLQACITPLTDAGKDLVQKLILKKSKFEQAGLCGTVEKAMLDVGSKTKDMIKAVTDQLPQELQGLVGQVGNSVCAVLDKGADAYSSSNCVNNPLANTSKSMVPYPTGTLTFSAIDSFPTTKTSIVQVTVTSCSNAVTQTSFSIVSPVTPVTPSYLPTTVPQPAPTTASVTPVVPPTTSTPAQPITSIPVAAGPRNAIGSAGLVAAVAVAVAMVL